MIEIFTLIAENRALQAISIIVAVGTLAIFVWKNLRSAFSFFSDVAKGGIRRAQRSVAKQAIARARRDGNSFILIQTRIFFLVVKFFNNVLIIFMPILSITLLMFLYQRSPSKFPSINEIIIILPPSTILSATMTWYIYRPFLILWNYMRVVRRHEFARIRRASR